MFLGLMGAGFALSHNPCLADGCFVHFRWNKEIDINEPTQKAIIVYDRRREDLILQVKYEGPAEDFGWLVPVPGLPEIRKGSMKCFYELSRLTQERGFLLSSGGLRSRGTGSVKVIQIKTVGAYQVTVLSAGDTSGLAEWLKINGFTLPGDRQDVLDGYVKKNWCFVAIKINPNEKGFALMKGPARQAGLHETIGQSTRRKLANGELQPLVISFDSPNCVFPLSISAINGKPSEISL